jgi:hypothetical protein
MAFPPGQIPLNPRDFMAPLIVTLAEVLDRTALPTLPLEEFVFPNINEIARPGGWLERPRASVAEPTEFATDFKTYVDKNAGTSPFCGHAEAEKNTERKQIAIGCPTLGVARRAMREAAPYARGMSKARQL